MITRKKCNDSRMKAVYVRKIQRAFSEESTLRTNKLKGNSDSSSGDASYLSFVLLLDQIQLTS